MSKTSAALAMLAAAAMLAVAGCGSSSSGGDSPQQAFARNAEQACLAASDLARRAVPTRGPNRGQLGPAELIAIRREVERALRTVDVPAEHAADYERFVDLVALQTASVRRMAEAQIRRDPRAMRAASDVAQRAFAEETQIARALNMDACVAG